MKILKVAVIVLVTLFTFSVANAQVRIRASIGGRPQHHRMVVRRPVHRRVVIVHRPVYRHHRPYRRHY